MDKTSETGPNGLNTTALTHTKCYKSYGSFAIGLKWSGNGWTGNRLEMAEPKHRKLALDPNPAPKLAPDPRSERSKKLMNDLESGFPWGLDLKDLPDSEPEEQQLEAPKISEKVNQNNEEEK